MACEDRNGIRVRNLAAHDAEVKELLALLRAEMHRREERRAFWRRLWLQARFWLLLVATVASIVGSIWTAFYGWVP